MKAGSVNYRILAALAFLMNSYAPADLPPAQAIDNRFGAVEAYLLPEEAAQLRVGWDRMIIHWNGRQPRGADEWVVSSEEIEQVKTAAAAGREIVALLMGTPPWATDGLPLGGVPRGLYLPVDDPNNLWANFVRRVVGEYRSRINHWIIWNEPDIALEDYGAQFAGSVEDYYQLVKVAYLAAKQANPDAVIHLAGLTYWHDVVYNRPPYLKRFLDAAVKDPTGAAYNYYFDVVTVHIYFRTETVFDIINFYRSLLKQYGLRPAIWLNETNAAPMDDPQYPWKGPLLPVTMDEQASFIIQANALALAAGAQRTAVYKFYDQAAPIPGGDSYGLFRPDGSARPAVEAFRVVTTHFAGVRRASMESRAAYHLIVLDRGRAITRVLWARGGQDVTVRLRAAAHVGSATLYDHLGRAYPLAADRAGYYSLALKAAHCYEGYGCVVGGAPWIVVERLR